MSKKLYTYSWFWLARYQISFVFTGLLIFAVAIFSQGFEYTYNETSSLLYMWLLFGVMYTYLYMKERNLVSSIEIDDREIIFNTSISSNKILISDISSFSICGHGESINGFSIKEVVFQCKSERFFVPSNIRGLSEILERIDKN